MKNCKIVKLQFSKISDFIKKYKYYRKDNNLTKVFKRNSHLTTFEVCLYISVLI